MAGQFLKPSRAPASAPESLALLPRRSTPARNPAIPAIPALRCHPGHAAALGSSAALPARLVSPHQVQYPESAAAGSALTLQLAPQSVGVQSPLSPHKKC